MAARLGNFLMLTIFWIFCAAPPVFEVVLRVIRPLMSPITRDALQIYGQDKAVWSKVLQDIADTNQLTTDYGGTYTRKES